MAVFETIVNAIGSWSWRPMFGVFVASGIILFFKESLGISEWEQTNHAWLVAAFLISGVTLLTYLGSAIRPSCTRHVADWSMIRRGKKHLDNLSNGEKEHCRWFVAENGSSLHNNVANGALSSLMASNILFTPGERWRDTQLRDFRIRPWALEHLKKHPHLLK